MAQAITYFTGFETGDSSELNTLGASSSVQNSIVRTGGYALKQAAAASITKVGLAATTGVIRFYLYAPALPAAAANIVGVGKSGGTNLYTLQINTNGTLRVNDGNALMGFTGTNGTFVLPTDTAWTLVEMACDLAASGIIKVWVNGVLDINITHTSDVTATPIDNYRFLGSANPKEVYVDDVRIDTGGLTPAGHGQCIARQGLAGTPAYDAWTKNGGATAAACWSDTPFDTTNYCDDTSLNAFQTMLVASFAASQTGHGTQVISTGDTINAVKAAIVGKSSLTAAGAGAANIRRRVGGVDTDTSITFTTSDAYYQTAFFTDTVANLNAYEIGGGHGAVAATHTIRDAWLMVDYTLQGGPPPAQVLHGTFTGIITGTLSGTFTFG